MRQFESTFPSSKAIAIVAVAGAIGVGLVQSTPAQATTTTNTPQISIARLVAPEISELPDSKIDSKSSKDHITALQTRLKWAALSQEVPSGTWTKETTKGVKKLQWKVDQKETGQATPKSVKALAAIATTGDLDAQCSRRGVVVCVDKTQKVARYLKDGKVIRTMHVNIGPERGDKNFGQYSATREGSFKTFSRSEFQTSTLYGTPMPYFMAFDKGIGFHHSSYFNETGYADASMGCVVIHSKADAAWLYENSPMKTRVVVYSS